MKNRLARILMPGTGRTVMLAIDHGYFLGPTTGLEEPARTIAPLLPHADSLMLTRGVLRRCVPPDADVPIVLRVSGGTSILRELSNEGLTVAIEDAIRLNASAVTLSIFVGAEGERTTLLNLAQLVDQGERHGIPVLAVTAVGKDMARDARYLGLACRIAAELGAHMVKTYYCDGLRAGRARHARAGRHRRGQEDRRARSDRARVPRRAGRCGRRRHGPQHLPVRLPGRHDPRRARRGPRRSGRERSLRALRRGDRPVRVAVYYSNNDVRIEERPRPEIGPGELLMRVRASGICGSDVMEWYRVPKAPLVLGHEVAGVVDEVGPGVDRLPGRRPDRRHAPRAVRSAAGTAGPIATPRVATLHATSFEPGGFAELIRLPAANVRSGTLRLPDSVSFEEGSFVEPLACVVRGQRLAGVHAGEASR